MVQGEATHIVNISILAITAKSEWIADILQREEDQTSLARSSSWLRTNSNTILQLLVDDNIVDPTERDISEVTSDTRSDDVVEHDRGFGVIDIEKLELRLAKTFKIEC